ncbi:unnamed protein product [Prorocentrum cordatum]|uniref:Uncharacterized protein n=1 Tax=Prorocentrum cordatum TaxID=2364126 RepID=A0ABN9VMM6_9DINO|nr:unnamed protein product [Polarella glacialis]
MVVKAHPCHHRPPEASSAPDNPHGCHDPSAQASGKTREANDCQELQILLGERSTFEAVLRKTTGVFIKIPQTVGNSLDVHGTVTVLTEARLKGTLYQTIP